MNAISKVTLTVMSFITAVCLADIRLPSLISNNMVLQQNSEVTIWGWADPGETVTVSQAWETGNQVNRTVRPGPDGRWNLTLKTPAAGGPETLTIQGNNEITIKNILFGEVWLCSGQSNMEWPFSLIENAESEIAASDYPQIRVFQVDKTTSVTPVSDCCGYWQIGDPGGVRYFSAVGYLFSRMLHKELNVPIGMIGSYCSGTPAESWINRTTLEQQFPEFNSQLELLDKTEYQTSLPRWQICGINRNWLQQILNSDLGTAENWQNQSLDDSEWKEIFVPGIWRTEGLDKFDGIVWYRKTFTLPSEWVGKELILEMGPIDDADITWVNGTKVGHLDDYTIDRSYTIPADLARIGANTLAVRVLDTGGAGGFYGQPEQVKVYLKDRPDKSISLAGAWKYKISVSYQGLPGYLDIWPVHPNVPSALYNTMIAPLIPYSIRGAIWYQGESNCGRHEQYKRLIPAMVQNWREEWGRGDFPFYYVQIAPYDYGNPNDPMSAFLREAQLHTLSFKNSGMAVTMDIGDPKDIHPRNKLDVAKRLALWALAKDYGRTDLVYSGPLYREMKIEGDSIRLFFDHVGSGLMSKGGPLTHFTIAGQDRKFVPARAVIEGDTIVVSAEGVTKPAAVRYGFTNAAMPNLFNKEGLPASSFRTDGW